MLPPSLTKSSVHRAESLQNQEVCPSRTWASLDHALDTWSPGIHFPNSPSLLLRPCKAFLDSVPSAQPEGPAQDPRKGQRPGVRRSRGGGTDWDAQATTPSREWGTGRDRGETSGLLPSQHRGLSLLMLLFCYKTPTNWRILNSNWFLLIIKVYLQIDTL